MKKLKFNKKKIEKLINKILPKSSIESYKEFSAGLISPTFKVKIEKPSKIIVIKLSRLKNKESIHKNNKILNYLKKNNIPTPKIYYEGIYDKKYITIMDFIGGEIGENIYLNSKEEKKRKILKNAGRILKKIHNLKIPDSWIHQHHEIRNIEEWNLWTKRRIQKYLNFFKNKLPHDYNFIKEELTEFYNLLNKTKKLRFVPLHWDYHLSNLKIDSKGRVVGVFDFDNAMKGHNLGDLGQTAYWIRLKEKKEENFKYFLKGYKNQFSKRELKMIKGYFLLHILAVSRSIWFKQKRLGWLIEEHKKMIKELKK